MYVFACHYKVALIFKKVLNVTIVFSFHWRDVSSNLVDDDLGLRIDLVITGASYDVRSNEIFRKLDLMPIHKNLSIRENIVTFKRTT